MRRGSGEGEGMKRLGRILLRSAALLPLILCVLMAMLWVVSYWAQWPAVFTLARSNVQGMVDHGTLRIMMVGPWPDGKCADSAAAALRQSHPIVHDPDAILRIPIFEGR